MHKNLAQNLLKQPQEKCRRAVMVIYLDKYRKAKSALVLTLEKRYGEELLWANWNPMVELSVACWCRRPQETSPPLPHDLSSIDLDAFLDRVYAFASQV
jgi:hypothetical protein